ncbi:carbohydrate kinase family protein [Dysosmobacter sp.]
MGGSKTFVSGAGSVNIDLIFSGLPRVPEEGQELYSQGFSMQMGGGIPATLVNLGRLGVPVRIQTGLGEDLFSRFAVDAFQTAGVEPCNLCPGAAGIPLNITAAMLTPGERTFVSYSDGLPVTDDTRHRIYEASRGAAICAMDPRFPEVYAELHREGTVLTLDTGWDDELSIEKYRPLLELADYYTPNQKEAMKITRTASPAAAARVLAEFFPRVVVKLDAAGCLIEENGVQSVISVIPEYVHQDSTGAGDAFLAGFLYGLYHGRPLAECVLYGNITGGKCVTAVGCLTAYCTEEELKEKAERYRRLLP